MSLSVGSRLSAYEIVAPLGAGGMGEVYRAKDTKLGRDVALKILPASFTNDPERVTRFRREAQVLASLNHPHIAQIYGLEESGDTQFLVLELVDGESLDKRIARGPIPVDEALSTARQIAEALEAAHEKGIIHRDLKPANIALTKEGAVKVLDFGLARALDQTTSNAQSATTSPTVSVHATKAGIVLGTAAYMSPEQARGKPVDKRADIWAFGCVLYEMLTGARAFPGETISDVVAATLQREPDWAKLPAATPRAVRRLLTRCLAKSTTRRVRDIGDARLELDDEVVTVRADDTVTLTRQEEPRAASWVAGIAVIGVAVSVAATIALVRARSAVVVSRRPVTRFAIQYPPRETLGASHSPMLAISADGAAVAFVTNGGAGSAVQPIYIRWSDQDEPKRLPDVFGASPFFSPDGKWMAYWNGLTRTIRKVALSGGAPIVLADADSISGGTWGEDGNIIWGWFNLFSVPSGGGTPKTLLKVDISKGERFYRFPQYLPGSAAVLFTIGTSDIEGYEDARIAVLDLKTGTYKTLIEGGSAARYSPTGHLVYARGGSLFAVPFDLKRLGVTGSPFPIFDGVFSSRRTGMADFALAANGDVAYIPGATEGGRRQLMWVDRHGRATPFDLPPRSYLHPRLSPDERQLAFEIEGPAHDLYAYDLTRGVTTRLTFDGASHWPIWSPTGDRIAFRSWKTTGMTLWSMPANRSEPERQLPAEGHMLSPESWSPDGQTIAYLRMDDMRHFDVWELPLDGGGNARPVLASTKFLQASPKFSPDGHWLAYSSNEAGRPEVFVTRYPGPGPRIQVSTDGGIDPVWRRNGSELYYRNGDAIMAVAVTTAPELVLSKPTRLWEGHYVVGSGSSCGPAGVASANYDVTADGQRFVMIADQDQDLVARQVQVIVNFATLIERAERAQKDIAR
jgi:serine/threonine-protein kinase